MTTSGTYLFTAPGDDLLVEAWERLGLNPALITGAVGASARRSLQLMLIAWGNKGAQLWQIEAIPLTTVAGVATITMPTRAMDILDIYTSASGIDQIMAPIGRSDYVAIASKGTQSRPTQVWVNRQIPAIQLNLFPTPDRAYAMTAYTLRQPQDLSVLSQTADAPVMWAEALAAGLAARLAQKFKPELEQIRAAQAAEAFADASGESRERVPLNILPDFGR